MWRGSADPVGKVTNVEGLVMEPTRFASTIQLPGAVEAVHDAVVSAEEGGGACAARVHRGEGGGARHDGRGPRAVRVVL